ncbi:MAG: CPBP family intramembrane glutamic endopeptidase [Gemmatimonadaceae bacterium]
MKPPHPGVAGASASYWVATRAPRYSLVFAIPLFLLYEALAVGLAGDPQVGGVRNAADVLLKTPFVLFSGARGSMAFFATVMAVCVFLIARDLTRSGARIEPRMFLLMLGESAVLALLLGVLVGALTQQVLGGLSALTVQLTGAPLEALGWRVKLMLSLGAGLYEELLFRVILVGGLAAGLHWLVGGARFATGLVAAVVGALIFSAFHYVGEYGDPLELGSFTYRAIAGLVFSGLYLTRGFGVTAWTHALYDVYVLLL